MESVPHVTPNGPESLTLQFCGQYLCAGADIQDMEAVAYIAAAPERGAEGKPKEPEA